MSLNFDQLLITTYIIYRHMLRTLFTLLIQLGFVGLAMGQLHPLLDKKENEIPYDYLIYSCNSKIKYLKLPSFPNSTFRPMDLRYNPPTQGQEVCHPFLSESEHFLDKKNAPTSIRWSASGLNIKVETPDPFHETLRTLVIDVLIKDLILKR